MKKEIIHSIPDFVEVSYRPELEAVYLKWFREYDEENRVREAVLAALDYVREHSIRNWIADVSTSPKGLSEADYEWVSSDTFRALISASPLRRFILVPPLPDTGQDTAWVAEWETNTLSKFEGEISAKVCRNADEIRRFLGSGADTRT